MLTLNQAELWIGRLGGLAALATMVVIFVGLGGGLRRPVGRVSGSPPALLRQPLFYVLASLGYFGLCYLLWQSLPVQLSTAARLVALILGALMYFAGLALILWGRLALGKLYFVSSSQGAQLFAGHQLFTTGLFALVRHPMYLGILLTGVGGILLYRTWTMVFFALNFFGLMIRARREEQALQEEFGSEWQAYCERTPRFFPRISPGRLKAIFSGLPPGITTLLEVSVMFLPAIPAYIWLWPNVSGALQDAAQTLTYIYVLAGTCLIAWRRSPHEFGPVLGKPAFWRVLGPWGLNARGLWLSLASGLAIILGRTLVILSVDWSLSLPTFNALRILGEIIFYFGLVGVTEELLFRGVIYRALDGLGGAGLAIWGSSLAFMLWHIFGQGPLVGAAMFLYGLIFALIRWRAGGILGLILVHGLVDFAAAQMLPSLDVVGLGRPVVPYPAWLALGLALIALTPVYLWKIHPLVVGGKRNGTRTSAE